MAETQVRFWPIDAPIPEGWKDNGPAPGHHGHWSRVLENAQPSAVVVSHVPGGGVALSGHADGKGFMVPLEPKAALWLAAKLTLAAVTELDYEK